MPKIAKSGFKTKAIWNKLSSKKDKPSVQRFKIQCQNLQLDWEFHFKKSTKTITWKCILTKGKNSLTWFSTKKSTTRSSTKIRNSPKNSIDLTPKLLPNSLKFRKSTLNCFPSFRSKPSLWNPQSNPKFLILSQKSKRNSFNSTTHRM